MHQRLPLEPNTGVALRATSGWTELLLKTTQQPWSNDRFRRNYELCASDKPTPLDKECNQLYIPNMFLLNGLSSLRCSLSNQWPHPDWQLSLVLSCSPIVCKRQWCRLSDGLAVQKSCRKSQSVFLFNEQLPFMGLSFEFWIKIIAAKQSC